jgi:hypothetical protein
MITAYHGKADGSAAEVLAVNPFCALAPTAARLRGYARSARPAHKMPPLPFKAMSICFDHGG